MCAVSSFVAPLVVAFHLKRWFKKIKKGGREGGEGREGGRERERESHSQLNEAGPTSSHTQTCRCPGVCESPQGPQAEPNRDMPCTPVSIRQRIV